MNFCFFLQAGVIISSVTVEKAINSFIFIQVITFCLIAKLSLFCVHSKDDVLAVASDSPIIQMFSIPSGKSSAKLEGHTQRFQLIIS